MLTSETLHLIDDGKHRMGLEKEFYSTKELADLLGVTELTIHRLVKKGDLVCVNVGRVRRFARSDIQSFIERNRSSNKPSLQQTN
jgi:excisionase family DNA binding protein